MEAASIDDAAGEDTGVDLRALLRRSVLLAALLALVGAAILWLPALEPVRDRFADTDGRWVAVACGLQVLSSLSFAAAFRGAFERRIRWRVAFDLSQVEAGANVVLPSGGSGGLAIGAVMLVRAGVPTAFAGSRTAVLFLVTSAVSIVALLLAGLGVASGLLAGDASLAATLGPAAVAAAVLVGAVVLPSRLPLVQARPGRRVRTILRHGQDFLRDAVAMSLRMLRTRDPLLIGGALGYFAFDVASLGAAFEALRHGSLPVGTFVLAYVIGHGGALIPLPGSAEGGLVGAFTGYGSPLSLAVGAVLVYRTFHAGVPVVLALFGYGDIRRLRKTRPPPEEIAKRFS